MKAIELIKAERERQINELGYNNRHDDAESVGALSTAGAIYALPWNVRTVLGAEKFWPWDKSFYKPANGGQVDGRIRELVKAGALIAAEIDRLERSKVANQQRTVDDLATEYAAAVASTCRENGNPLPEAFVHLLETAYVAGYNLVVETK